MGWYQAELMATTDAFATRQRQGLVIDWMKQERKNLILILVKSVIRTMELCRSSDAPRVEVSKDTKRVQDETLLTMDG